MSYAKIVSEFSLDLSYIAQSPSVFIDIKLQECDGIGNASQTEMIP